jgi:phosphoribosyl 1,2-cyclic phosphodiesterase
MNQELNRGCRLCTLYSGSGGNATYISDGESAILIDAGKSAKALTRALREIHALPEGKTADARPPVDAIFITHEHTDHVSALKVFLKKYRIPVHVTEQSASYLYAMAGETPMRDLIVCHPPLFTERVGRMTVRSFPTSHDSLMSVGYRVTMQDASGNPREFGYATDLGRVTPYVEEGLFGCEAVVIESNHDPDMLLDGPYPYPLKLRIRSSTGHLSNEAAAKLAARLWEGGTRRFLLAHLSKENNLPLLAVQAFSCALKDAPVTLAVADPERVTYIIGGDASEELC